MVCGLVGGVGAGCRGRGHHWQSHDNTYGLSESQLGGKLRKRTICSSRGGTQLRLTTTWGNDNAA